MIPKVKLGLNGPEVSRLGLGCLNFGDPTSEEDSFEILKTAYEEGIFFWDTGDRYGNGESEEIVGRAIHRMRCRDQIVLCTKARGTRGPGPNELNLSHSFIVHAVEGSLRRLQTDYIDLYQLHRPSDNVPLEETLQALEGLIQAGKLRYYGTSTCASWQMAETEWTARSLALSRPVSEQAAYNILDRRIENDRAGFVRKYGWGLITWAPLGGGQLTGKYRSAIESHLPLNSRILREQTYQARMNTDSVRTSARFVALCKKWGYVPAQAAVAWLLHQPLVTVPNLGPRTKDHLTSLLPATSLKLPSEFLAEVDRLVPPGTAVADFLSPNVNWQIGHLPGIEKHAEQRWSWTDKLFGNWGKKGNGIVA